MCPSRIGGGISPRDPHRVATGRTGRLSEAAGPGLEADADRWAWIGRGSRLVCGGGGASAAGCACPPLAPLYPALLGEVSPAAAAPAPEEAAAGEKAAAATEAKAAARTEAGWGGGGRRSSLEPCGGRRAGGTHPLSPSTLVAAAAGGGGRSQSGSGCTPPSSRGCYFFGPGILTSSQGGSLCLTVRVLPTSLSFLPAPPYLHFAPVLFLLSVLPCLLSSARSVAPASFPGSLLFGKV